MKRLFYLLLLAGSAHAQLALHQGWNQIPGSRLQDVCPPATSAYDFPTNCHNVVDAWSGGVADSARSELVVFGGGGRPADYKGNEVYTFSVLTGRMLRITNPGPVDSFGDAHNVWVLADGSPNSRHSYGGLQYMPTVGSMFMFGGALQGTDQAANDSWVFDRAKWVQTAQDTPVGHAYGVVSAWDSTTGSVLVDDNATLWRYAPAANAWTSLAAVPTTLWQTMEVDPAARIAVIIGGTLFEWVDFAHGYTTTVGVWPGCEGLITHDSPGLAYDSAIGKIVGWGGGDSVFFLDAATKTCAAQTVANGPGAQSAHGTFGRFRYFPTADSFALVNDAETNAWILKLSAPAPTATPSPTPTPDPTPVTPSEPVISAVQAGPAVLFDTVHGLYSVPITWTTDVVANSQVTYGLTTAYGTTVPVLPSLTKAHAYNLRVRAGVYHFSVLSGGAASPDGTFSTTAPSPTPTPTPTGAVNSWPSRTAGVNSPGGAASILSTQSFDAMPVDSLQQYTHYNVSNHGDIALDCLIGADGCSLHFTIRPGYQEGNPGWFSYNFTPQLTAFGPGQEFYVQYRERVDAAMLNPANFPGTEGFKLDIVTEGDSPTGQADDCVNSPSEFVTIADNAHAASFPSVYVNCGFDGQKFFGASSGYQPIQMGGVAGSNFLDEPASGCPHYDDRGTPSTGCFSFVAGEWFTIQKHVKIGTFNQPASVIDIWAAHDSQPAVLLTNAADIDLVNDGNGKGVGLYGKIVLLPFQTGLTPANGPGSLVTSGVWYDDLIVSARRIPDPQVTTPNAPDSLTSSVAGASVTLAWRLNSQNATLQDNLTVEVERCAGSATTCFPAPQAGFTTVATLSATAVTFTDSPGAGTFTYRVRASNTSGHSAYAAAQNFNSPGGSTVSF